MIFIQCISGDIVALQVVKVDVSSRENSLFGRANGHTALIDFFTPLNEPRRNLMPNGNVLREGDLLSFDSLTIARANRRYHYQHIVLAVNAQQLR